VIPSLDIARWGTYGELINIPARLVVKHPDVLTFNEAAAAWMQYITVWGALVEQARLSDGDFVIATAASSSVGIAAFQIARMVGARVIATTRTGSKRQALLTAGAHHVIATDEEDLPSRVMEITNGAGARIAFDAVGGRLVGPLTAAMARGGTLIGYGALSPEPTALPMAALIGKGLTLKGYHVCEVIAGDSTLERAKAFILAGLESGALKPLIARLFPLDQIREAHRFLESNDQIGKVVVTV
jgi:NADPH:quinone reductase-like Zn-dependent oxidoreductase